MAKKPSNRNTKSEILAAYNALAKEKAAIETELQQVRRDLKTAAAAPRSAAAAPKQPVVPATTTNEIDVTGTIEQLTTLHDRSSFAIGQLSETLTRDAIGLRDLQGDVTDESGQLADLHELTELTDETLEGLVREYQDSAKAFAETFEEEQEALQDELLALQQAWETEQEEHERTMEERDREYITSRDRAKAEYIYGLQLARNLDEERYRAGRSEQYRELDEQRETLEREWTTREEALAEREKDYRELKEKVEAHEDKLKAEKKRGEETGRGIAKRQAQVAADLRAKEIEGETQRYELRVQSLQAALANEETQISQLNQQLEAALKQVQDLAVKAIEGAASAKSLQAVKDIALEQAKNSQRGK
ncbi:MAG: hypothetical protein ACFB9N_04095 [Geitlerinemataceae cyanobacterium]